MLRVKRSFLVSIVLLAAFATVVVAQGVTVQVTDNETLGPILTDANGNTLYVFEPDEPGVSNCADQCAEAWPPLTVDEGQEPTVGDGVSGDLAVIERADGARQVTYNEMPLYSFVRDEQPGDVNGQGVDGFGGEWYAVPPGATSFAEADEHWEEMQGAATEAEAGETPETLPETGAAQTNSMHFIILLMMAGGVVLVAASGAVFVVQRRRTK